MAPVPNTFGFGRAQRMRILTKAHLSSKSQKYSSNSDSSFLIRVITLTDLIQDLMI